MPAAGFNIIIPAVRWPRTYALDHVATGIGSDFTLPFFTL
jgi:hypothetical protein